ncbi:polyamine ABC transporter substrate-binding protein [Burkholderia cenocepacia]|nr:polyamine ABC transporter substrate-binding protein [Burkholderia cenocepacia]MCW5148377.1 polyamine ABC transporter substrate-binding protein [Burkholderia cenocepacia]MDN7541562.1 polyamine ABC transporter substrate-binding protein [Burkholderia cenocepacia]MDS0808115.1 polyamine ABC transporter substrate-binding protein [Burkholderia cenocepacia]
MTPVTFANADDQLNFYNWAAYIAKDTIPNFQKQTGIRVKYDSFDSDDTLQAKLLMGNSNYDVVVTASNYMPKQIQAGLFLKLDKSKIPNLSNLDPVLMKKLADSDPGSQYGVPWAFGTDGIAYNVEAVRKALGDNAPIDSWALVFDPVRLSKLKGCGVSFVDQPSNVFADVLQYMGKNPNSTNPNDYQEAYETLRKVRPYITQFNSMTFDSDLAGNDICVALGWSGGAGVARRRAIEEKRPYEIRFINPKEGGILWFDVMAVPKDAPHPDAAMKWINYIEEPKVNAAITNAVFYPSANQAAQKFVVPAIASDRSIYPPEAALEKMTLLKSLPVGIMRLENRLWLQLKTRN